MPPRTRASLYDATFVLATVVSLGCAADLESPERFQDASLCPTNVQEDILVRRCTRSGCHVPYEPTGGIDYLSADLPSRLVGVESSCPGRLLIDPDAPDESYLLERLSEDPRCREESVTPMPQGIGPLPDHELACVRTWIHALAGAEP